MHVNTALSGLLGAPGVHSWPALLHLLNNSTDSHRWIYIHIMDQTNHGVICLRRGCVCVCRVCVQVYVCLGMCIHVVGGCSISSLSLSPAVCLDLVSTDKSPLDTSPPTSITFFWAFSLNCQSWSIAGTLKHFKSLPWCYPAAVSGKKWLWICTHGSGEITLCGLLKSSQNWTACENR